MFAKPPTEYGLPKEFWDVPQSKTYAQAEFGVVYERVPSHHFLPKFSELSFKYPAKFNIRRDEEGITTRMEEIQKEVVGCLKDPNWEVFASDETMV